MQMSALHLCIISAAALLEACSTPCHGLSECNIPIRPAVAITDALNIPKAKLDSLSGLYLLENGGESMFARLWLIDHAQTSIDLQYYSIANDITGTVIWDHLVRAADRGVKIRILLDDAASKTYGHLIQLVDSHQNIEIRVSNGGLKLGRIHFRILALIKNSNRLLRRMHNKTCIADGQFCIAGGRNIGDEYFDFDERYNFRDRDLMLSGKVSKDILRSFNIFWDHPLTLKYEHIAGKQRKELTDDPHRFDRLHYSACDTSKFSNSSRAKIEAFPDQFIAADKQGRVAWISNPKFIFDNPGEKAGSGSNGTTICTDSVISLIRSAKRSIDIQSPYVILTKKMQRALTDALQRGIKVRILTNSLASIDNFEPFAGYQKCRPFLVRSGVELYEFRPDAAERFEKMIPDRQAFLKYKTPYGFHVKSLIVDGSTVMIGSYNFDPRSEYYNTECICIFSSETTASALLKTFEKEIAPENSWKVSKNKNNDRKASTIKRIKTLLWWPLPKRLV
ncbi:MAG: phospholipase D-like domain-containing protein [Bacteroidia bacterium]